SMRELESASGLGRQHYRIAVGAETGVRIPQLAADFGTEVHVLGAADLVEIGDLAVIVLKHVETDERIRQDAVRRQRHSGQGRHGRWYEQIAVVARSECPARDPAVLEALG